MHFGAVLIPSALLLVCGAAFAADSIVPGRGAQPAAFGVCLKEHYPNFKGSRMVWGYMPGPVEQEAICRMEFAAPELQLAKDEVPGDEKSPVTLELRKLWLMERILRLRGEAAQGSASAFTPSIVHKPPKKYLEVRPGSKPEQVPHLDTTVRRQWVPDLLRTLDSGKAGSISYFRRSDEQTPAICIEPDDNGVCREIVAKEKYELQQKKKGAEQEGGFRKFVRKMKDSVAGSAKEISEARNTDFYGVRLVEVAYAFDYDYGYVGFFARVAVRKAFVAREQPQYVRDVFGALVRQFGEPALKWKGPLQEGSGTFSNYAVWLTEDGFRIDAVCDSPAGDRGVCRDGRVAVRRLPPMQSTRATEGAGFFD